MGALVELFSRLDPLRASPRVHRPLNAARVSPRIDSQPPRYICGMDVFLVPVAPDRYELYCEGPEEPAPAVNGDAAPPPGVFPNVAAISSSHAGKGETRSTPDAAPTRRCRRELEKA